MTNNLDEFDQEIIDRDQDLDPSSVEKGGLLSKASQAWKTQPLFKLGVIMAVVVLAIVVSLNMAGEKPLSQSKVVKAPDLKEAPGGKSSPYFIEQNKQAANQRAEQAMQQGGSAIPTPVGQNMDMGDLSDNKNKDPLTEFRAETERLKQELKQEQRQNSQQLQQIQKQVTTTQSQQQFDDSLAQAMQKQMQSLMTGWSPSKINVVAGVEPIDDEGSRVASSTSSNRITRVPKSNAATVIQRTAEKKAVTLVSAGTISYGQLLIEANSDVQGPILAQIVSGPFTGAKAIGQFKVESDYLVLRFNLVNFKGKDYSVNILALNPDTTLGGMASEVDQRYFSRVVLPAAASFMSSFGQSMGQGKSDTTITGNAVVTTQASKSLEEGMYSGMGQAGQTVGQFFQNQANSIKPLVRIAAGTPMGMFFLTTVYDNSLQSGYASGTNANGMPGYAQGYNNMGNPGNMDANNPYAPYTSNRQQGYSSGTQIYGPSGYNYNSRTSGYGSSSPYNR
ncbi:MAG: TrbI/VirB10 family protein [Alphaproteobacteria bacterium]|nr:TrbI/VirB10 family protein [Alphaproteobacteria bacterium]